MASTTSGLRGKKQSLSLNPRLDAGRADPGAETLVRPMAETFHRPDYGTFLPARDFSNSILNSDTKREASAVLARVEVRKVLTSRLE
jgi:hypothetical protein